MSEGRTTGLDVMLGTSLTAGGEAYGGEITMESEVTASFEQAIERAIENTGTRVRTFSCDEHEEGDTRRSLW